MTGGMKNPNASVSVQKVAGGRTGGGNAKATVDKVATPYKGGISKAPAKAEPSKMKKGGSKKK